MKKLQAILKFLNYKGIYPWEAYLDKYNNCVILLDLSYDINMTMSETLTRHFHVYVTLLSVVPLYLNWKKEDSEKGFIMEAYVYTDEKEWVDG